MVEDIDEDFSQCEVRDDDGVTSGESNGDGIGVSASLNDRDSDDENLTIKYPSFQGTMQDNSNVKTVLSLQPPQSDLGTVFRPVSNTDTLKYSSHESSQKVILDDDDVFLSESSKM